MCMDVSQEVSFTSSTRKMKYLPLIEQLALLCSDEETVEMMKMPSNNEKDDVLCGILDGTLGEKLPKCYNEKKDQLTLYLGLYNDGYQIFKNGKHTMTVFVFVVMNLPEEIRTENNYLLQVCIAPGAKAPHDFFSFIKPIKQELDILQDRGFKLKGSNMTVKAHMLFSGGDIPAQAKISGTSGHVHLNGCRCCTMKAFRLHSRNIFYPQSEITLRKKSSFREVDIASGQKFATPLADLKYFHGAFFFPIDYMHLFGQNIGPQIANLLTTDDLYVNAKATGCMRLNNKDIHKINVLLRSSCLLVPTTFSGVYDNLGSGYNRAVDWLFFLRYSLSTTIIGFLPEKIRPKVLLISRICNLACQREIKKSDIAKLKDYITEWLDWLSSLVLAGVLQPWVFTINQHFLQHLHKLILRLGPMPNYGAFPVERCIQENKGMQRSNRDPHANSGNVVIELAAIHWIQRTGQLDASEEKKRNGEVLLDDEELVAHEVWGPISKVSLRDHQQFLKIDLAQLLEAYSARISNGMNDHLSPESVVEFGSRLWSPDKSVLGCSNNHKGGNRTSFFVKLCLEVNVNHQNGTKINNQNRTYFGEVLTYLRYTFPNKVSKLLAFTKIFDVKSDKNHVWPFKTASTTSKIKLVNVDEIVALCGRSIDDDDREYIFWPYQESHDLPLGRNVHL